ncbi:MULTISPECIES: hypothetical protein [unclassified Pedobacter]|jgi:hypothetical protein|uniref:hypothetical protein n=1 Tax=Pedobacter TaxID=84567 RepID=UPI000B4B25C0|nr:MULTISPECIES: hypothetical protein [unclassified Pedobacter]MCX2429509.1 hypothetical protein [Pedobacter sp. GR22-10]MCX2585310.1 hypothetical protein [Pedobacter sp. MR22-3]OWK70861.1 hypothetical protein CBW18_07140 [Pedobacter sp. AJM]
MQNTSSKISADLQAFINKFEPSKFKVMSKGIEIRGINDIHRNITHAKEIIEMLELNLEVSHNAEMLSYKGFEVNNLQITL